MKKSLIVVFITLLSLFVSSCSNGKIGLTDMEIAKYLSQIDGITEIGSEDYDIPFDFSVDDWVLCVCPSAIHAIGSKINDSNMMYYSVDLSRLISFREPYGDSFIYYDYWSYLKRSYIMRRSYLTNSIELPYLFQGVDSMNCSPEWHEWLDYNIPYSVGTPEEHGLFNIYWFNPVEQKYERGIYIREIENATEIYAVFHEISLFYGTDHVAPYLLSEEMFEKMQNEFGESFNADGYVKGTVSEFSNWFMGEYLKEVPSVFANIEEEVYFPKYGGSLNYSYDEADELVPEMIDDLKELGVNFDLITSCIIKITIPYNSKLEDISWELIA